MPLIYFACLTITRGNSNCYTYCHVPLIFTDAVNRFQKRYHKMQSFSISASAFLAISCHLQPNATFMDKLFRYWTWLRSGILNNCALDIEKIVRKLMFIFVVPWQSSLKFSLEILYQLKYYKVQYGIPMIWISNKYLTTISPCGYETLSNFTHFLLCTITSIYISVCGEKET